MVRVSDDASLDSAVFASSRRLRSPCALLLPRDLLREGRALERRRLERARVRRIVNAYCDGRYVRQIRPRCDRKEREDVVG